MSDNRNVTVDSVSKHASDSFNSKMFGLSGTVLLTSASNYTGTAGESPVGSYTGFIIGSSGVTITTITYSDKGKHLTYTGEDINSLGFVAGQFLPLHSLIQIKISAGSILLYKE